MFANKAWLSCGKIYGLISVKKFATIGCVVAGSFPQKINPLAPELFFLILAHPVYKM